MLSGGLSMKYAQVSSRGVACLACMISEDACFSIVLWVSLVSMLACQTLHVHLILLVSHAACVSYCLCLMLLVSHAAWMSDLLLDVACALVGSLHSSLWGSKQSKVCP